MVNSIMLVLFSLGALITIFIKRSDIFTTRLIIASSTCCILLSVGRTFSIMNILVYPIVIVAILIIIIIENEAWKSGKTREKKFAAYYWLIVMPCIAVLALVMYILIESGVFGK